VRQRKGSQRRQGQEADKTGLGVQDPFSKRLILGAARMRLSPETQPIRDQVL
jgi:hypothetical protein